MKLIAQKPCSFGGKKFYIGEEIPAELVLNPQVHAKLGTLTVVADDAVTGEVPGTPDIEPAVLSVVVHAKEGDLPITLSAEGLQAVVDALTSNADDAGSIIKQIDDRDALALLYYTDSRKTVKEAAEARARAVDEEGTDDEESEGEQ